MNAITPIIPETAPFTPAQRAWLNGFLAGLYGGASGVGQSSVAPPPPAEDFPWHDPTLEMDERLALAEGKPVARRLMAAMAQLDCGQCGYLCQTYAEALADGRETSISLCVPGAKPTSRMLKKLLAEAPAPAAPAPAPVAKTAPRREVRVASATRLTGIGSAKDVRHVVIDLAASGLVYEPGDSISIAAPNDPALVEATLAALRAKGEEPIACPDGATRPLRDALTSQFDIARPLDRTLDLLAMTATYPPHAEALRRLTDGDDGAEPDGADLLESEFTAWLKTGTLTRLDTAFSRDQREKIYVQDRMRENAADIWRWLQDGGYFYVCGDASHMARDVDATLRRIAMTEGNLDEAQARDFVSALARQGRYQRDVY